MAYTLNVTALNDYINEFKTNLISAPLTMGDASKEWDIVKGNKHSATINYGEEDIVIQCGDSCTFDPDGETIMSQKTVSVQPMKVNQKICYEQLDNKYLGAFSNPGTSTSNTELAGEYLNHKVELIANDIEDKYWNSSTGDTCGFAGLIEQLEADSDREVIPTLTGVTITSANVVASIATMASAFPKAIKKRTDLRLYVSDDIYDLYVQALIFNGQSFVEFGDADSRTIRVLGTKIVVKAVVEFETQLMIGTYANNFQKHTDMENEYEEFIFEDVPNTSAKAFRAAWKIGIGIKFAENVVTNF